MGKVGKRLYIQTMNSKNKTYQKMRNGSNIFACPMEMSKAFDLVKQSILFKKLWHKGLPVIFIQLLLFIYMEQFWSFVSQNLNSDHICIDVWVFLFQCPRKLCTQ